MDTSRGDCQEYLFMHRPWGKQGRFHPTPAMKMLPESPQLTQNRARTCSRPWHPISPCSQGGWSGPAWPLSRPPDPSESQDVRPQTGLWLFILEIVKS